MVAALGASRDVATAVDGGAVFAFSGSGGGAEAACAAGGGDRYVCRAGVAQRCVFPSEAAAGVASVCAWCFVARRIERADVCASPGPGGHLFFENVRRQSLGDLGVAVAYAAVL